MCSWLEFFAGASSRRLVLSVSLIAMVAGAVPAQAQPYVQIQSVEVTPFIGVRFGGTFDIQPDATSLITARLKDAQSLGFSAGVRFDDLSLVAFRWTQATSALRFDFPFASLGPALGDVTINQFHADFTREWIVPEVKGLRSYLTGSVGLTHLGAGNDGFTRFSFGLSSGLKQFLGSHLAIRGEASWLPIWIEPEVGSFACGTIQIGGCFVILTGRLTQQYEVSAGPVFSF